MGDKAHGLVQWHDRFIMLDSDNSALVSIAALSPGQDQEGDVPADPKQLWKVMERLPFVPSRDPMKLTWQPSNALYLVAPIS